MLVNTEYKLVNNEEFRKEYGKLHPVIRYRGKLVAELGRISYHQYHNCVKGVITNPAILGGVLQACKMAYNQIIRENMVIVDDPKTILIEQ